MITKGELIHNPAINLRVKGTKEQVTKRFIDQKADRASIYENYQAETPVQKRNKIMISFYSLPRSSKRRIYSAT
jgi:hypothetical protein